VGLIAQYDRAISVVQKLTQWTQENFWSTPLPPRGDCCARPSPGEACVPSSLKCRHTGEGPMGLGRTPRRTPTEA
jgi:hypothetical protein